MDMTTIEVSLQIEGMHCGGCVGRVDQALRSVPGVTDAAVNLTTGTARVSGRPEPEALIAAVESIGFKARALGSVSAGTLREIHEAGRVRESATGWRLLVGVVLGIPAMGLEG